MKTLETLEVGDLVIVSRRSDKVIGKIERLTKTQIILTNKQKFSKSDGWLIGSGSYPTTSICVGDVDEIKAVREDIQRGRHAYYLSEVNYKDFSLKKLQTLVDIVNDEKSEESS